MEKIIYEKRASTSHHISRRRSDRRANRTLSWGKFFSLFGELPYVEIPERIEGAKSFVRQAIEFAKNCGFDLKVTKHDCLIAASLAFDEPGLVDGEELGSFVQLCSAADRVVFFHPWKGRDMAVDLHYYTHELPEHAEELLLGGGEPHKK